MKPSERDELLVRLDQRTEDEAKNNNDMHERILVLLEKQNGRVRKNTIAIVALGASGLAGGGWGVSQLLRLLN